MIPGGAILVPVRRRTPPGASVPPGAPVRPSPSRISCRQSP